MQSRLSILFNYLSDVAAQKVVADPQILRSIKALCYHLPIRDHNDSHETTNNNGSDLFNKQLTENINDSLLVAYLASITNNTDLLNNTLQHFNRQHHLPATSMNPTAALAGLRSALMDPDREW